MISSLQLAKECGVSQGTVDRALHDRPGIAAATRDRIKLAAARHGYQPHPAVRELLQGRRTLVGAIIPAHGSVFFLDLANAIRDVLARDRLRLLLCPVATEAEFLDAVADFASRRALGVVGVPPRDGLTLTVRQTSGMTVVALLSPCRGPHVHEVSPDEVATGRQAVDYLWQQGHRRILHVTYTREARPIRARAQGYTEALRRRGGRPVVITALPDQQWRQAIQDAKATAIFCHNDWLALTAIRQLAQEGLRVPEDVSVLGVDHSPTFAALCPNITSLEYPFADVAAVCAHRLHPGTRPAPPPIGRFALVKGETVRTLA
jgi:DNA-binding LacI/PurR family transcriptional regulator